MIETCIEGQMKTMRYKTIQQLQNTLFDVCVVGGGITGAGVAREAALRGLKVALVEAQDFASGTSSASSKLVHGGLRYLEQLEFNLVLEALLERNKLLQMAPHLVHYGRFVLPLFKGDRVGPFKMGLGMCLYDALSLFSAPLGHEYWSATDCIQALPHLKPYNLKGAFVYSDAHMDDARMVIETLRSAHRAGALCLNYAKAIDLKKNSNTSMWQVKVRNQADSINPTNAPHQADAAHTASTFYVQAKQIMCAVGPWADEFAHSLWPEWTRRLKPSKGVHLCLKPHKLKLQQAVVMAANSEKRIVFAHPHQGVLLVGTTDTAFDAPMSSLSVTPRDQKFLLSMLQSYFPTAGLCEDDVITSFAGVRPLIQQEGIRSSQFSRRPLLEQVQPNLWFLLGGKYTTYRKMAYKGVEAMVRQLPVQQQTILKRADTGQALNALATQDKMFRARLQATDWARDSQRPLALVQALIERHGEEALSILHTYNSRIDFKLPSDEALYLFEAYHARDHLWCLTAQDFYRRRTGLAFQYAAPSTSAPRHSYLQKVF